MNGKAKGSEFERAAAKLLDEYWGVKPHTFWRTPLSGGWNIAGDIAVMNAQDQEGLYFPFVVECKAYKVIDLLQILTRTKTTKLFLWWEQVTRERDDFIEATGQFKFRLLLIKINNFPVISVFNEAELPQGVKDFKYFKFRLNEEIVTMSLFSDFREAYPKNVLYNFRKGSK